MGSPAPIPRKVKEKTLADKKKPDTLADTTPSPVAPESLRKPTPRPVVTPAWEPNPPVHPLPDPPHPYPIDVVPAPVPFSEPVERKTAYPNSPTHERVGRLEALIAKGNPVAVLLSELGTWHETQASNADGSWKVREFIWPNTPGALAAIRELGLHE